MQAGGGTVQAKIESKTGMGPNAADIEAGRNGWKLYLVGWVSYRTAGGGPVKHFDFARVYDPERRRFFPVENDPDYAHDPDDK